MLPAFSESSRAIGKAKISSSSRAQNARNASTSSDVQSARRVGRAACAVLALSRCIPLTRRTHRCFFSCSSSRRSTARARKPRSWLSSGARRRLHHVHPTVGPALPCRQMLVVEHQHGGAVGLRSPDESQGRPSAGGRVRGTPRTRRALPLPEPLPERSVLILTHPNSPELTRTHPNRHL